MTNKNMKIITIISCCCLVALSVSAIVTGSIAIARNNCKNETVSPDNIDFSQLTYVALGDSITYGVDGFSKVGNRVKYPYPELVEIELLLQQSVNCGISGSTIASGLNSYYPMAERYVDMPDGDIVSVLGGVNDFWRNIPLGTISDTNTDTFYGALNTLAKGLKSKYPNAFIFFMTPYKYAGLAVNGNGNTLKQFADAVKEVCVANDLPFLDMYNYGNFEMEMNTEQSDGVHPSQSFFKNHTAPQIAQFIRLYYNK